MKSDIEEKIAELAKQAEIGQCGWVEPYTVECAMRDLLRWYAEREPSDEMWKIGAKTREDGCSIVDIYSSMQIQRVKEDFGAPQ